MIAPASVQTHSSSVRIRLLIEGQTLAVGKMGPERIMLKAPRNLPACDGELALTVDGKERRWPVRLPDGACESTPFVRVEQLTTNG